MTYVSIITGASLAMSVMIAPLPMTDESELVQPSGQLSNSDEPASGNLKSSSFARESASPVHPAPLPTQPLPQIDSSKDSETPEREAPESADAMSEELSSAASAESTDAAELKLTTAAPAATVHGTIASNREYATVNASAIRISPYPKAQSLHDLAANTMGLTGTRSVRNAYGPWWQVLQGTTTGWIHYRYLTAATASPTAGIGTTSSHWIGEFTYGFDAATTRGTRVEGLSKGTRVFPTGQVFGEFSKVATGKNTAWVLTARLSQNYVATTFGTINHGREYDASRNTVIRQNPFAESAVLSDLLSGTTVLTGSKSARHSSGGWWQVRLGSTEGWVLYADLQPAQRNSVANPPTNGGLTSMSQPRRGTGTYRTVAINTQASPNAQRVVRVAFQVEGGLNVDTSTWATYALNILNDPRGWGGRNGSIAFVATTSSPDVYVRLTSPATVDRQCAPLNTMGYTSCRVGNRVILNVNRWRDGAAPFNDAGGTLPEYRSYVLNHEIGHFLGRGHVQCPAKGRTAPVMQQQTLRMDGCKPNGWTNP